MLRISNIIERDSIFDLLKDERIFRISINRAKTSKLKNKKVCYVHIYVGPQPRYNEQGIPYIVNVNSIFENILSHSEDKLQKGDKSFLKGIRNQKRMGFFTSSQILKLKDIEKRNGISFGIPDEYLEFILTFKNI